MKNFCRSFLITFLACLPTMVYAEDIEIYMEPAGAAGSEPLVMFNLDYRSNLGSTFNLSADDRAFFEAELGAENVPASNTYFTVLQMALEVVFKDLAGVKIGLMLPHNYKNNCEGPGNVGNGCGNGGYIAMGFQSANRDDTNGQKARFINILKAMPQPQGGLSHSWQGSEIWFEFYRYLTGRGVYNGRNGHLSYAGAPGYSQNKNLDDPTQGDLSAISWDTSIMEADGSGGLRYISPLEAATHCTRLFTISFTFGNSNQDSNSNAAISASPANGGMGIASPTFERVLRLMNDADLGSETYLGADINGRQNVVGWFITDQANPSRHALAAAAGTSLALAVLDDPQLLVDTLNSIFQQILSVSTTFVAASVPVNVFNRSEIVDNVYIALFQADSDRRPAWPGSLKKLRIEQDGNTVRLVDQLGNDAVAADGRINFNALTYWTDPATLPPPDESNNEVAERDGRAVDRGGAGQRIPGFTTTGPGLTNAAGPRTVLTEPASFTNGVANVPMALDADAATATALRTALGAADDAEALTLIKWVRGMDVDDLDLDTSTTDARPWILGDPLHSRPLPVNFGARAGHSLQTPDIRILMGSNDGFLRLFRNTNADGSNLGEESWAFMPREVMDQMSILRANIPLASPTPPHPYTVDGAPVVFVDDINGNGTVDGDDKVIAFVGLRRGGRSYYALEITNPDDPRLLWRISGGDTGFEQLGLTFSTPQIGFVRLSGVRTPVLVFAGGYDPGKDARPGPGADDDEGNAIFVVNALTGALVWKVIGGASTGSASATEYTHVDMVDSIPSDTTAVDTNGDGFIDRVYVGDTGGTVWRVDMLRDLDSGDSDPATWTATPLAFLGRHYSATGGHDRRFFHAPDVVLSRDADGVAFDAVIVGSGDRANPLDRPTGSATPMNFLYMIKDRAIQTGTPPVVAYDHDSFGDVTDNCLQSDTCGIDPPDLENGWRLGLEEALGEKSLAVPFTISGTIFFTTYLPPGSSETATCGPSEGGGMLYAVALADARSTINFDSTDDDPNNPGEPTSRSDRTRELRSGGIPAEVVSLPPNRILLPDLSTEAVPGSMRWRTFWYENEDPNGF